MREVILADDCAGQLMSVIPGGRAGQGLVEDEGGSLGVGQQLAVAQRGRDDGVNLEIRILAMGQPTAQRAMDIAGNEHDVLDAVCTNGFQQP
ncbi:hypothetical protein D3C71_1979010 [compost metagenome]